MATIVTDLEINHTSAPNSPKFWAINVTSDNASSVQEIRSAVPDKRNWIESVVLTMIGGGTGWVKIMSGTTTVFGPIILANGVPWIHRYHKAIHGEPNTAINLKSSTDFGIHLVLEGHTDA